MTIAQLSEQLERGKAFVPIEESPAMYELIEKLYDLGWRGYKTNEPETTYIDLNRTKKDYPYFGVSSFSKKKLVGWRNREPETIVHFDDLELTSYAQLVEEAAMLLL